METSSNIPSCSHQTFVDKVSVSNHCKGCDKDFEASTILKHLSHTASCKSAYSIKEIQAFRNMKKKRRNEVKKDSYDPNERRKKYQKEKEQR